jgi:hypothetical protein
MFYIGQKVVCVNDRFPQQILEWTSQLPRQGHVYTICRISPGKCLYTRVLGLGVKVEEIQTLVERFSFCAQRFAPLLEKLDEACQRNASELTSPAWVETPVRTPAPQKEAIL